MGPKKLWTLFWLLGLHCRDLNNFTTCHKFIFFLVIEPFMGHNITNKSTLMVLRYFITTSKRRFAVSQHNENKLLTYWHRRVADTKTTHDTLITDIGNMLMASWREATNMGKRCRTQLRSWCKNLPKTPGSKFIIYPGEEGECGK